LGTAAAGCADRKCPRAPGGRLEQRRGRLCAAEHARPFADARLGLECVHEIDNVEEAASGATTDAGPYDTDGEMRLAGAGPAERDKVALLPE